LLVHPEKKTVTPTDVWTEVIRPQSSLLNLGLRELWKYRGLILLFVKRDFVSIYKQTILGPLWHLIQPLFTTLMFTFIFGRMARLSTDGAPDFLFYMCGVTMWSYFSQTLTSTANTFVNNANIFGKVYFPRLTVPIAVSISSFISFAIQLCLLIIFYLWFILNGSPVKPDLWLLAMPWFLLILALWSLGLGIIVSSMTTKYHDLRHAITFGVQLYMYISIIYPTSSLNEDLRFWALLNPLVPVIEAFRYAMLGTGHVSLMYLMIATVTSLVVFLMGIVTFNKVERTFMDTV
jgi:lipopolysaccharide transport system permease protein